jgi:hypothetical protein
MAGAGIQPSTWMVLARKTLVERGTPNEDDLAKTEVRNTWNSIGGYVEAHNGVDALFEWLLTGTCYIPSQRVAMVCFTRVPGTILAVVDDL